MDAAILVKCKGDVRFQLAHWAVWFLKYYFTFLFNQNWKIKVITDCIMTWTIQICKYNCKKSEKKNFPLIYPLIYPLGGRMTSLHTPFLCVNSSCDFPIFDIAKSIHMQHFKYQKNKIRGHHIHFRTMIICKNGIFSLLIIYKNGIFSLFHKHRLPWQPFFLFFHMRKEMSNNGYTDWRSWLVVVDMVIYIYYTEHTCNFIFHVFPSSINIFNYSVFTKSSRNSKFCHCHWLKVQWENRPVWSCRYVIKIIVLFISY